MPGSVLEHHERLSRSILWELQRRFFAAHGIDAWRKRIVPQHVTTNPFIAAAYSAVVSGFLRDCQAAGLLDNNQPLFILEPGAGSGKFAYHFLTSFLRCAESRNSPFQYLMTDFASRTIEDWEAHPALRPFVKAGHLAFGRFDAGRDGSVRFAGKQIDLEPGRIQNPLIVLANYFFDSIPHDLFYIRNGLLYEQLVSVCAPEGATALDSSSLAAGLQISFESRLATENYYGSSTLDALLKSYISRQTETALLFPTGAISCIQDLSRLCGGRMLLLAADQGFSSKEELAGQTSLAIDLHGSFSMQVNYHAIGEFVRASGGEVMHPRSPSTSINVSCFALGAPAMHLDETRRAFEERIVQFGPDDFFTLKRSLDQTCDTLSPNQLLTWLQLSGGDTEVFFTALPALLRMAGSCTDEQRNRLRGVLHQVWNSYFALGEEFDLPAALGAVLFRANCFHDACTMFEHSRLAT